MTKKELFRKRRLDYISSICINSILRLRSYPKGELVRGGGGGF
jgi:hypothetical protein